MHLTYTRGSILFSNCAALSGLIFVSVSDGEAALTSLQDVVNVLEESIQHTEPSSVQTTPRSVRSQTSTIKK